MHDMPLYYACQGCLNWLHLWGAVAKVQGLTPASPKPDTNICALCSCYAVGCSAAKNLLQRCLHDIIEVRGVLKPTSWTAGVLHRGPDTDIWSSSLQVCWSSPRVSGIRVQDEHPIAL